MVIAQAQPERRHSQACTSAAWMPGTDLPHGAKPMSGQGKIPSDVKELAEDCALAMPPCSDMALSARAKPAEGSRPGASSCPLASEKPCGVLGVSACLSGSQPRCRVQLKRDCTECKEDGRCCKA